MDNVTMSGRTSKTGDADPLILPIIPFYYSHIYVEREDQNARQAKQKPDRIFQSRDNRKNSKSEYHSHHPRRVSKQRTLRLSRAVVRSFWSFVHAQYATILRVLRARIKPHAEGERDRG